MKDWMYKVCSVIILILIVILVIITGTFELVLHNTNELMSIISSYVQTICIVVQSVVLFKQLDLSQVIEEKTREENKGIFILDATNIITGRKEESNNKYDLSKPIFFHNRGNDHVILKAVHINGKIVGGGYRTFFTNLDQYSKLLLDLKVSKEELEKDILKFDIDLFLENLKGYNYTEKVEIRFRKDREEGVYNLDLFNIKLN